MKKSALVLVLILCAAFAWADTISPGYWMQTASTAGDAEVSITIQSVTERILSVDSSNGWKGFAWYDDASDMYTGFFELLPNSKNPDARWRNRVFQMKLKYDGLTLTLDGQSGDVAFVATYWKK